MKKNLTLCVLPGATVETPEGSKLIEDIVSGDVVIDEDGNQVTIIHNIKFGLNKKNVITFKKGCFTVEKPDAKLSITEGHSIKVPFGKTGYSDETTVENFVNLHTIQSTYKKVKTSYTLMTENRIFVITNGIPVSTWAENDFTEFSENANRNGYHIPYELL